MTCTRHPTGCWPSMQKRTPDWMLKPTATEGYGYEHPGDPNCDEIRKLPQVSNSNQVMEKFLDDVKAKVCVDRQDDYGLPEINHARTAQIVTTALAATITPEEVCVFNIAQKLSRCANKLTYDSLLDIAGYCANCAAVMAAKQPMNGT